MLNTIDAEAMTGDEGFTQQNGVTQVKTRSLYQAVKEFLVSSIVCRKQKFLRKVKNRKGDLGEERTRKKEKQTGENLSCLACPSAGAYAYHCRLRVRAFPTPSAAISNSLLPGFMKRGPIPVSSGGLR